MLLFFSSLQQVAAKRLAHGCLSNLEGEKKTKTTNLLFFQDSTWQPLADTCNHLQPLGSHLPRQPLGSHLLKQPCASRLAATCCNLEKSKIYKITFFFKIALGSHLAATWQPLGSHLHPLATTCSHLAATWQQLAPSAAWQPLAATCPVSHLQPLAATCSHLQPLAATCPVSHLQPLAPSAAWQPLAATCSHLQPLAATCSHLQPLAATCPVSHLQPLGSHLQPHWLPLAPSATCSHLQPLAATCSHLQPLAATCPVSHLQPLAATWQPLAATVSHLQPLAATGSHLQPLAPSATCSHLQPLAATCSHLAATYCSHWSKWLQVADISKIKLGPQCEISILAGEMSVYPQYLTIFCLVNSDDIPTISP